MSIFEGLDELREQLKALPRDLGQAAGDIIVEATNDVADTIFNEYPDKTGHLRGGVKFSVDRNDYGAVGTVRSTAKIAWMFENGTVARHYISKNGVDHLTGAMPAKHTVVRAAVPRRRKMYEELKAMVEAHPLGLEVSGDADS